MITVAELRTILTDIPGHYKVWITLPDDEHAIACITQDKATIHLCASEDGVPVNERLLYSCQP